MADNYFRVSSLPGLGRQASSVTNRVSPITADISVVNGIVADAIDYCDLLFPLYSLLRNLRPANRPGSTLYVGLKPSFSGSITVGRLKIDGLSFVTGDVEDYSSSGGGSLTFSYLTNSQAVALSTVSVASMEEAIETLIGLARESVNGLYDNMPQLVSAVLRNGRNISAAAEQKITSTTGTAVFDPLKTFGLDNRFAWAGGVLSNPAAQVNGSAHAVVILQQLEQAIWPELHNWLKGSVPVNLSALKVT